MKLTDRKVRLLAWFAYGLPALPYVFFLWLTGTVIWHVHMAALVFVFIYGSYCERILSYWSVKIATWFGQGNET